MSGRITFYEPNERKHANRIKFSIHLLSKKTLLIFSLFDFFPSFGRVQNTFKRFSLQRAIVFALTQKTFPRKKLQSEGGINGSFL